MPVSEYKMYLDNAPADDEQLNLFSRIKVDQGIGMATEAEIEIPVGMNEAGVWSVLEDDFAQPFKRIRIEVKIRDGNFVPLFDGPVIAQRFELAGAPNISKLLLTAQDDSVLLNLEEQIEVYENKSPDEIAQQLFSDKGLSTDIDSVEVPAGGLDRYLVRRGTTMQFLRELARRHGMFVYVEPDATPGISKGIFKRPNLSSGDYPELLLAGANRNINNFMAEFDALRPLTARADSVNIIDQSIITSEASSSGLDTQGDAAVHTLITPGKILLARTREESVDLDAATAAAVDHSSWAYTASAEVMADRYSGVLQPYKVVTVAGAGGYLSGNWLISHVTHTITDSSYTQAFSLRRNARSSGTGSSSSATGGIL